MHFARLNYVCPASACENNYLASTASKCISLRSTNMGSHLHICKNLLLGSCIKIYKRLTLSIKFVCIFAYFFNTEALSFYPTMSGTDTKLYINF